jgi:hypothetical protein
MGEASPNRGHLRAVEPLKPGEGVAVPARVRRAPHRCSWPPRPAAPSLACRRCAAAASPARLARCLPLGWSAPNDSHSLAECDPGFFDSAEGKRGGFGIHLYSLLLQVSPSRSTGSSPPGRRAEGVAELPMGRRYRCAGRAGDAQLGVIGFLRGRRPMDASFVGRRSSSQLN